MKHHLPRALRAFTFSLLAFPVTAQTVKLVPRTVEFQFDGVDFAPDGYLYYGGSWKGGKVFRSTLDGAVEEIAAGFEGPTDTVMDSKGNLFVSNYNANYISCIAPDGEVHRFAETPRGPAGMAIDAEDNIFVTIYGTPAGEGHSVLRVTPAGLVSTYIEGPELHASVGLAIDDTGALFISGGRDGRIYRSTQAGQYELFSCLPLAEGRGGGGHLDWAGGYLFASSGIGAAYRIDPSGAIHYLVVDGEQRTAQGPAISPLLRSCNGLAAAPDGRTLFLGCASGEARTLVRLDGALPPATPQAGWAALKSGRSELAERIFAELASKDPVDPGVHFGLGSLRYRERRFAEAADYFEQAAKAPHLRVNGLYNAACARALNGEVDRAFGALDQALDAGYADAPALEADKDLTLLHADPRWDPLVKRL